MVPPVILIRINTIRIFVRITEHIFLFMVPPIIFTSDIIPIVTMSSECFFLFIVHPIIITSVDIIPIDIFF